MFTVINSGTSAAASGPMRSDTEVKGGRGTGGNQARDTSAKTCAWDGLRDTDVQ